MTVKKFVANERVKHGTKGAAKYYNPGDTLSTDEKAAESLVARGKIKPASEAEPEAT